MRSNNGTFVDVTDLRLDLGDGDSEVDGSGEPGDWKSTCRNAPADAISVPRVILEVVCRDEVDAVQPVVLILPSLPTDTRQPTAR